MEKYIYLDQHDHWRGLKGWSISFRKKFHLIFRVSYSFLQVEFHFESYFSESYISEYFSRIVICYVLWTCRLNLIDGKIYILEIWISTIIGRVWRLKGEWSISFRKKFHLIFRVSYSFLQVEFHCGSYISEYFSRIVICYVYWIIAKISQESKLKYRDEEVV